MHQIAVAWDIVFASGSEAIQKTGIAWAKMGKIMQEILTTLASHHWTATLLRASQ